MQFLDEEVQGALMAQKIRGDATPSMDFLPTAAAFYVNTKTKKSKKRGHPTSQTFCVYCEDTDHWGQDFQGVNDVKTRSEKLKATNRYFLCLRRGHNRSQCYKRGKAFSARCKEEHHISICNRDNLRTSVGKIGVTTPDLTFLTARTCIKKLTRCILDGGIQSSFIHSSLTGTERHRQEEPGDHNFEASSSTEKYRRQDDFDIMRYMTRARVSVAAFESHNTYSAQPTPPKDIRVMPSFNKIKLADPQDDCDDALPIETFIGSDYYWKIITMERPIRVSPSLVLLPTIFGYIFSGNTPALERTKFQFIIFHSLSMRYQMNLSATFGTERQLGSKNINRAL